MATREINLFYSPNKRHQSKFFIPNERNRINVKKNFLYRAEGQRIVNEQQM